MYSKRKPPRGAVLNLSNPLARGLVGAWIFNARNSTVVRDLSGNQNHGTMTNMAVATDWLPGPYGPYLDFDGTDDYLSCGTGSILDLTPPFTLAALVNPVSATENGCILGRINATQGYRVWWYGTGDNLYLQYGDGTGIKSKTSSASYTDSGAWVHVAITASATATAFYRNGSLVNSTTAASIQASGATDFRIGSEATVSATNSFGGGIDHVYVWKRILTTHEISRIGSQYYLPFVRGPRVGWPYLVPTAATALSVALADNITVSDALTGTVYAATMALADSMTLADALAIVAAYSTTLADDVTAADAMTVAGEYSATLADSLSLADAITTTYAGAMVLADSIGFADAGLFAAAYTMALADGFTLADAISFAQAVYLADAVSVSDALTQALGAYTQALADGLSMADALTASGAYSVTLADGMTLADAIVATTSTASLLRDTLNILATRHTLDIAAVRTTLDILKTRHTLGVDTDE